MLANRQIKRRDGCCDEKDIQRIRAAFYECCLSIERCVQLGRDMSVPRKLVERPEVVKCLHLIGFELGAEFVTVRDPERIGLQPHNRIYLIPT